jgi:serine protease AprX
MKALIESDYQNLKASIEAYKSTLDKLFGLNFAGKEIIITSFESKIINYEKDVTSLVDRHQLSVMALEHSFDIISNDLAKGTDRLGLASGDEVVSLVNQHELFMNLIADRKQLYKLTLDLIRSLDSILNNYSTQELIEQVRQARNDAFARLQRLRLLSIVDESEVISALLWMTERGKEIEDLIAVENFSRKFSSSYVEQLSELAEKNILRNLQNKLRYYRIICNKSDLTGFVSELYLVESYPSFSIIAAQNNVVEKIRQLFPVTEIVRKNDFSNNAGADFYSRERSATMSKSNFKVIQLDLPINTKSRKQLIEMGVNIIMPLGKDEYVVSFPANDDNAEIKLDEILGFNQVSDYYPQIDNSLEYLINKENTLPNSDGQVAHEKKREKVEILESGEMYFPGLLVVMFFNQKYKALAMKNLEECSIRIIEEAGDDALIIDLYDHPDWKQAFATILEQDGLQEIEADHAIQSCNDRAVPLIMQGVTSRETTKVNRELTIEVDEIIAICDNGLDTGDIDNIHPDLAGQVIAIEPVKIDVLKSRLDNPANFGPDTSSHGTHVSGSAIGKGTHSSTIGETPIIGSAHGAKLFFQANEFSGVIDGKDVTGQKIYDLKDLFRSAYNYGARIHSNSWTVTNSLGTIKKNQYNFLCKHLDEFMWQHKDFLVIVAAGNEGVHSQVGDGIDKNSIVIPGTAKNCLTVGASENNRMGEFVDTYGDFSTVRFPHNPFNGNQFVDSIDDIAAFSSRGCCQGRFKPDVVAPGTFVLSTKSSKIPTTNCTRSIGTSSYNLAPDYYMYMSGTSMATPLVAGCAARVRQYLRKQHITNNPSSALIKAILIHSAEYIDYEHKHSESSQWLDNEQGWGRVTLANSLVDPQDAVKIIFEDRIEGMITGESYEYKIKITKVTGLEKEVPIRIILTYTDYPGKNLVNNLNLMLCSPNNKHFYGNNFAGEQKPDTTNNVEGIVVESPEEGLWKIVVIADYVQSFDPLGENREPQDFALVASGYGLEIVDRQFRQNFRDREK